LWQSCHRGCLPGPMWRGFCLPPHTKQIFVTILSPRLSSWSKVKRVLSSTSQKAVQSRQNPNHCDNLVPEDPMWRGFCIPPHSYPAVQSRSNPILGDNLVSAVLFLIQCEEGPKPA
jgi:hypothetical protein